MASAANAARLYLLASRQANRLPRVARSQHFAFKSNVTRRAFTVSTSRRADEPPTNKTAPAGDNAASPAQSSKPTTTDGGAYDALFEGTALDMSATEHGFATFDEYLASQLRPGPNSLFSTADERKMEDKVKEIEVGVRAQKTGFWFDEDDPDTNTEEHDEFDEDDITEMAHGKLEEVREMRHYERLAVWELPLLSKLAKPFEPPTEKQALRWRYTTYMGDTHPAEKKVVVQFAPDDLGLTPVQADKLKKLAGPRFNPETELVKMSCESYAHPAQNKRYLSNLVDDLITAAKDPKDTFEDVPLDLRHHKTKPKPRFPKEWLMTEDRRKELDEARKLLKLEEVKAVESGSMVDGKQAIETHLVQKMEEDKQKVAELVAAPKGATKPATWASKTRR